MDKILYKLNHRQFCHTIFFIFQHGIKISQKDINANAAMTLFKGSYVLKLAWLIYLSTKSALNWP